jgi:hypothetical protein
MNNSISLQITKTNGRYSFTLQDNSRLPLAYEVFLTVPRATRNEVVALYQELLERTSDRMRALPAGGVPSAPRGKSEKELAVAIGENIARFLFPRELARVLNDLLPSSLLITTNDPLVPWEMMRVSGDFLCSSVSVGKCVKTTMPLAKVAGWKARKRVSMLLISNPTGDLPGADRELEELRRLLENDVHFDLTILHRDEATFRAVAEVLNDRKIDILHFAGHTAFGNDEEEPKFYFHDTPVSAQYLVNILSHHCPPLLFLNSCNSALISSPGVQHNYLSGVSPHFLHAGTIGVVGALWPVIDDSAADISKRFYATLSTGSSIGESLRRAKADNERQDQPASWIGYILVGDPDLMLIDDSDWKSMRISQDGYASARDLFSGESVLAIGGIHPFLISAAEHEAGLVAVASDCRGCQSLVLRKGLEGRDLPSLRGMRIGVAPFTGMHVFLHHLLDEVSMSMADFRIIFLEKGEMVGALLHARIDAAVIWEPWQTQLLQAGHQQLTPRREATDYTLCCVAARRRDIEENNPKLLEALRRYYYCVDRIRAEFNFIQLLSLQFDLPVSAIEKAVDTFKFLDRADLTDEVALERRRNYAEEEMNYMLARGLLHGPSDFARFWTPLPLDDLMSTPAYRGEPLPVTIQESISCTPFIVGRFLGLFY